MISFELTMPNVNTWDGTWSGQNKKYFLVRRLTKKQIENLNLVDGLNSFFYDFGDGWSARIKVEQVDTKEANKRKKLSSGFCGYDWMIESIISNGKILIK